MMSRSARLRIWTGWLGCFCLGAWAAQIPQTVPINDVEEAVPPYSLPEALTFRNGKRVTSPQDWPRRRAELVRLFEEHVYGRIPDGLPRQPGWVVETRRDALGGKAIRQRIQISLTRGPRPILLDLLVYRPSQATQPVPVFLGLNFDGNHTVTPEIDVPLARGWVANRPRSGVTNNVANGGLADCSNPRTGVRTGHSLLWRRRGRFRRRVETRTPRRGGPPRIGAPL